MPSTHKTHPATSSGLVGPRKVFEVMAHDGWFTADTNAQFHMELMATRIAYTTVMAMINAKEGEAD